MELGAVSDEAEVELALKCKRLNGFVYIQSDLYSHSPQKSVFCAVFLKRQFVVSMARLIVKCSVWF